MEYSLQMKKLGDIAHKLGKFTRNELKEEFKKQVTSLTENQYERAVSDFLRYSMLDDIIVTEAGRYRIANYFVSKHPKFVDYVALEESERE